MEKKRIQVGQWSFEKSDNSFAFHLYKDTEITNKEGVTRIEPKLEGYDMPMTKIVNIISTDEAFECSETMLGLQQRILLKTEEVAARILEQLIKE